MPASVPDILDTNLDDGELAYIVSLKLYFKLDKQSTEALSPNHVLPSASSGGGVLPGRWKQFIPLFGGGTIVFEPGNPDPFANVYATWAEAYQASVESPGVNTIEISDAFISPVIIPAGTYDLHDIVLSGNPQTTNLTFVSLEDGVVFSKLGPVTNKLLLTSFATTMPVHVMEEGDFFLMSLGAQISSDATATQPFFAIPPLSTPPLMVFLTGGGIKGSGTAVVFFQPGSYCGIILEAFARLDANVLSGPGGFCQVIVSSQSAFVNTTFPIVQTGLGTLSTTIFSYAGFTSFNNLNTLPWAGSAPENVEDAINRMATLLQTLNGGSPIP